MNEYIDTEKDCEESERRFRRFLLITVVAIGCLLLIILLLFADRYNWLDFLAIPLKDMARFVRRNLSYIVIGFFCAAALFALFACDIASTKYANKKRAEIECNVSGSVPIPLDDFIRSKWEDSVFQSRDESARFS